MPRTPNRLAKETSPYLLSHANNPVDWHPFDEQALSLAKSQDKPIFLSIGYSTCHFCHVMERESFEDKQIAEKLNKSFISIKVDREERPDLDEIYMRATVAISGSGGWPMTVLLTPEGEPFFAGTYFPPRDEKGRLGLMSLLTRVEKMWQSERATLLSQAKELSEHVANAQRTAEPFAVSEDSIRAACRALGRDFDPAFGGFGGAPKFPAPAALALLLCAHARTGQKDLLAMVERTLDGMHSGGMYDQLGGGFSRYSVDRAWLVPHFEKMLTDNAQLAEIYIEGFQATGNDSYARVARETLDYVLSEMQSPSGGFFTASDADSEGAEGKYYVFHPDEVRRALGEPHATRFSAFYGITEAGNFHGKSVLTLRRTRRDVARELGVSESDLLESLELGRARLLAARRKRVAPDVDDKVLAAHSGLMMRALARGARTFGDPRYLEAAERTAAFILADGADGQGLGRADGGLFRAARAGRSHIPGFLEDYVFVADGLLALYEVTGRSDLLEKCTALVDRALTDFSDEDGGALYFTAHGAVVPLARPRNGTDSAMPNANAALALLLAKLAIHLGRPELRERAVAITRAFSEPMRRAPRAFCSMLRAVDFMLGTPLEVVTTGHLDDERTATLRASLTRRFIPHLVEVHLTERVEEHLSPLARGRGGENQPTAYVCESSVCQAPTTSADDFRRTLEETRSRKASERSREMGTDRLPGQATPAGTQSYFTGRSRFVDVTRSLDGLVVSPFGLGTHRVGLDQPAHEAAVREALLGGINLLDTSPSFALGDSERLIGKVVTDLAQRGTVSRDQLVVMTKIGVALGSAAEELEARRKSDNPPRYTVPLGPVKAPAKASEISVESGAFSLDSDSLAAQLDASLSRLSLGTVDVCLIQSPEHLLAAATSREVFEEALLFAFRFLEGQVQAGKIGRYGVFTNTATRAPSDPLHVSPEWLLDLAARASGDDHHFRVVALPINLVEKEAVVRHDAESLVKRLEKRGVSVLATRPLSAFVDGALLRLADPPPLGVASPGGGAQSPPPQDVHANLRAARYRVASLEAEFETTMAGALRLARRVGPEAVLPLSGPLGKTLEQTATRQQFDLAETTLVTPRLRRLLADLDAAFGGPSDARWTKFRDQYVRAVGGYLGALAAVMNERNRALLAEIEAAQEASPDFTWSKDGDWVRRAVDSVRAADGVTSVLVGLRSAGQVRHLLGVDPEKTA